LSISAMPRLTREVPVTCFSAMARFYLKMAIRRFFSENG